MESTKAYGISPHFVGCRLKPQGAEQAVADAKSPYKVNSFYLDSAGRVQVSLPLQLSLSSSEALQAVLASHCIQPPPPSINGSNDDDEGSVDRNGTYLLSVEARVTMTFGTGEAISATVESVQIESTRVKDDEVNTLCLQVQANLRVSRQGEIVSSVAGVKLNLEVFAVLTEKHKTSQSPSAQNTTTEHKSSGVVLSQMSQERHALAIGLRDLHLGHSQQSSFGPSAAYNLKHTATSTHHVVTKTRLTPPILCQVGLNHALSVESRSMNGPTLGETWIALNISHSNTHSYPVTITNVTLHPAFSQSYAATTSRVGEAPVVDMSQNVHWRFLDGCSRTTKFPKILQPNDAYSTVLYLTAEEDIMSRKFTSPISVTAAIYEETLAPATSKRTTEIVAVAQGEWTSAKRPVAASDSFCVDITLPDPETVTVGKIFSLSLSIYNLGPEHKDLKVLVLSSTRDKSESESSPQGTCIVFENPDITKLVLGSSTSGEDVDIGRKHLWEKQLLAVDDSCFVGPIKSLERVDAQLRFIPLRAGTCHVPNLELASLGGKEQEGPASIYSCLHNLEVVAKL